MIYAILIFFKDAGLLQTEEGFRFSGSGQMNEGCRQIRFI